MSKYVPPSKREGYKAVSSELPPGYKPRRGKQDGKGDGDPKGDGSGDGDRHSLATLAKLFDTPNEGTFNYFNHIPGNSNPRPRPRLPYDPDRTPETAPLPPSPPPAEPQHPLGHLVAYIVMFGNAHPMWESHRELWSHTNAQKLIDDEKGLKQNFGRPIPVFQSHGRKGEPGRKTSFQGWWYVRLSCLRLITP